MADSIEPGALSCVRQSVTRGPSPSRLLALFVCGVLAACGSKAKDDKTTPDQPNGKDGDTELMGDGDPIGANTAPGQDPDNPAVDTPADKPADEPDPGDSEPAPPKIEPPDLDIGAAEASQRLSQHLSRARDALRKSSLDPDLAMREARMALAVDPTNIDAVAMLAHAYYHKRLYDTAEVVLDMTFRNRKKAKNSPRLYYVYGLVYDRTERPERAKLAYEKALELAPNYRSALVNVGVHYLSNKAYRRAVEVYERLTGALDAGSAVTWTNLGSAYRGHAMDYPPGAQRDDFTRKAETAYRRALQADRNYAPVYYNLGLLFLDADPYPGRNGPMDKLKRLERSKTYFDEYKNMSGANLKTVERRLKQVKKLIKRETKRRKRATEED